MEAVNRSAEAVSRRVAPSRKKSSGGTPKRPAPKPRHPDATEILPSVGGGFRLLRLEGRAEAARHSFEISRTALQETRNGVILGRLAGGVDVLLDNDEISRRHARIFLDARVVKIDSVERDTSIGDQEFYQTQYGLLHSQVLAIAQKIIAVIGRQAAQEAPEAPAAMDATGMAMTTASDYFRTRKGGKVRKWVKVSVVVLCGSLFPVALMVGLGPNNVLWR